MHKHKYKILLVIFIIGFAISTILSLTPVPVFCGPEQGCDTVQSSPYAYLFGIKNATYGIGIFLILILLTLLHMKTPRNHTKHAIHTGVILGAAIALYFLYLQQFVIKAYCRYCIVIDIALLIGLIISLLYWKH
ncbi:MAG: vitamin K epoxide reductase family protein [Nanoarchaeota archaeon]|nr:vitamin K epoxide reductase family protein [Nanoarchaeota archaeon]